MATAEADTSRDDRSPPGGLVYDGFISYSYAADNLTPDARTRCMSEGDRGPML
jgi:hypothetical protein